MIPVRKTGWLWLAAGPSFAPLGAAGDAGWELPEGVVAGVPRCPDGLVVHGHGVELELEIRLQLRADRLPHVQRQVLHLRNRVEEQQPLDDLFGVLHLVDRLLLDEVAELGVPPALAHLGVQEVLVDGGQLLAQRVVQVRDDGVVSSHGF